MAACPACREVGTKELKWNTVKKKICSTRLTRAAKAEQKYLVPARQANEPTKEGPLPFILFESPFTSVPAVSRGHPSLVSLRKITFESVFFLG
jgi:hypothetical protein